MGSKGMIHTGIDGIYTMPSGSHVVDKVYRGQRIYHNFRDRGMLNPKEAEKYLKVCEGEIAQGIKLATKRTAFKVSEVLDKYWNDHLQYLKNKLAYRSLLNRLDGFFGNLLVSDNRDENQLKRSKIDEYKRCRLNSLKKITIGRGKFLYGSEKVSPSTVKTELSTLSCAINFLISEELLFANPISRLCHVEVPQIRKIVLDEGYSWGPQWQWIYENISAGFRLICLILYETGMRPREVLLMRTGWIKCLAPERYIIEVPSEEEKTGQLKEAPVSLRLLPELLDAIKGKSNHDLVIPSTLEKGVSQGRILVAERNLRSAFKIALKQYNEQINTLEFPRIDIKRTTPYAMRRTRITIWDRIDTDACRYAVGHVPKDVHGQHYVVIPHERLFRLVGLEYSPSFMIINGREKVGTKVA
ncbi:MAG: site-specific integrase [Syntrophaceae bacterium]|nr:site-specific integrase [Syntrophaceae bacterium]